ncbi:MAG: endonuclease/exonuclease/phosphatase family protein [Chloroflexota bacterium]
MTTFSLLTLNCFGVPAPQTRRRLLALADELNRNPVSVVCFQEVQANIYRRLLIKAGTRYSAHAYEPFVHAPKGGLLTLTQSPIEHSEFTLYLARGRWYTFAMADRILHKGILITRITVDQQPVIILNTHLNANYLGDWQAQNHYTLHERSQLRQLAEVVNAQPSNAVIVVAGDFNIPRHSSLYEEFIAASGLTDPMTGDPRPTFRVPRGLPERYEHPIDFAFWRAPQLPGWQAHGDLRFREKMPLGNGRNAYFSDHYGIQLELTWNTPINHD